jgi:hypothetical protein
LRMAWVINVWSTTMAENKEGSTKLKDALEDTLDFQETVESLITSRPDLVDPERLRLFEETLHRRIAMRSSTRESAQTQAMDAIAAAEVERSRKLMAFATTVGGGGVAALITSFAAPRAPAYVIVGMGILGLLASKFGAPRLDSWADRRQQGRRRSFGRARQPFAGDCDH